MADPEPHHLELRIDEPLRQLFHTCEQFCTAECCGLGAFDVSPTRLAEWMRGVPLPSTLHALSQFEVTSNSACRHSGPVVLFGKYEVYFDMWDRWDTPADCLTYFAQWRQAIAQAVAQCTAPPFFSPAWLTEPVVGVATSIAAERAFDRLPILADALEETGCDNLMMLAHLRANDDHAHHCWVVDVLRVETEPLSP